MTTFWGTAKVYKKYTKFLYIFVDFLRPTPTLRRHFKTIFEKSGFGVPKLARFFENDHKMPSKGRVWSEKIHKNIKKFRMIFVDPLEHILGTFQEVQNSPKLAENGSKPKIWP